MHCEICLSEHDANDVCDTLTPFAGANVISLGGTAIMGAPTPQPRSAAEELALGGTAIMGMPTPQPKSVDAGEIAAELLRASPIPASAASAPYFLTTPQPAGPVTPLPFAKDDTDDLIGKVVSGFRVIRRLGRGGM